MKTQFETGATSAQANNLILSILNDGQIYDNRLNCGFAILQGSHHIVDIRELVQNEAKKQRLQGCTFPASSIKESVTIITKDTLDDCLDIIRNDYSHDKVIIATCRRWLDKIYGNSYFSVNLQIPLEHGMYRQVNIPMQYGHGSNWQYSAIDLLVKIGILPKVKEYDNGNKDYGFMSDYEVKGIIQWVDQGYMKKNQMFNGVWI